MLGFFKNILRKMVEAPAEDAMAPTQYYDDVTAYEQTHAASETGSPSGNGHHANGKEVELPLQLVLKGLPLELQPLVWCASLCEASISIPIANIHSKLSRGSVNISFGYL